MVAGRRNIEDRLGLGERVVVVKEAVVAEGLRECDDNRSFRNAEDGLPLPVVGLLAIPELLRGVGGAEGGPGRSVYTS